MPQAPSNGARAPNLTAESDAARAFGRLCDRALHELSVARTSSQEMIPSPEQLARAWELSWFALDRARLFAEDHAGSTIEAWPAALKQALRESPLIPLLPKEAELELLRARQDVRFAPWPERSNTPAAVDTRRLARELGSALEQLSLTALSAWITDSLQPLIDLLAASIAAVVTRAQLAADGGTPDLEDPLLMKELLQALEPMAAARAASSAAPSPANMQQARPPVPEAVRQGDEVQISVFRPRQLAPERWTKLLAFAHLAQRRPDAPAGAPDPIELVREQARTLLGSDMPEYRQLVEDAAAPIPLEGKLRFRPEVDGVEFVPSELSVLWVDDVQRAEFQMRARAALAGKSARGRLTVFCDCLLIAELQLTIPVAIAADSASHALAPPESVRMYRKIFASYSHNDANVVNNFRELAKAIGDRYLIDVSDLRAGERWSDALEQLIRQADVFQLFWSWSSMRSQFVRREWEFALQLGRDNFVRPTYWEHPMPKAPGEDLPPPKLSALHFQALSLPAATAMTMATPTLAPPDGLDLAQPTAAPKRAWLLRRITIIASAVVSGGALLFVLQVGKLGAPPKQLDPVLTMPGPPASSNPTFVVTPPPKPPQTHEEAPVQPPLERRWPSLLADESSPLDPDLDTNRIAGHTEPKPLGPRTKRFTNMQEAKRALRANEIDEAEYRAAVRELRALHDISLRQAQRDLADGKISSAEYERQVNAIRWRFFR